MPGPQVDQLVEQIRQALPRTKDLDAAVREVRDGLEVLMPGLATSLSDEISEARQVVELDFEKVEILHSHSVFPGMSTTVNRMETLFDIFRPCPISVRK